VIRAKNAVGEEVTEILQHYGYTPTEIHGAIKQASKDGVAMDTAEELLRYTLKLLGAKAVK
jgi:Holliday junction resolvasome RuvABC DNA-binding subunit